MVGSHTFMWEEKAQLAAAHYGRDPTNPVPHRELLITRAVADAVGNLERILRNTLESHDDCA